VVAVSDVKANAAIALGQELKLRVYDSVDQLFTDKGIDLIYIATPPGSHYTLSKQALLAGKHVICEKPAALKVVEAIELVTLAKTRHLLYVVNLMQRYNPLFDIVLSIVQEKLLGGFLHGFFENYASDEFLSPAHWFWDEQASGGIFIEHGVHFFDLFAGWLGKGKVVSALQLQRPDWQTSIIDRVQATVLYEDGFVNFYHGFDQPKILDRQEMKLQFEHGEITLHEWVPVKMRIEGLVKEVELERLFEISNQLNISKRDIKNWPGSSTRGRFKEIHFDAQVCIEFENKLGKDELYQAMLTGMIKDQWAWIRDKTHLPVIDGSNAVTSLSLAEQALSCFERQGTYES